MLRFTTMLACVLISATAAGQVVVSEAVADQTHDDGFKFDDLSQLGVLGTDDPGSRFFQMLRASHQVSERPFTFEETVGMSTVIARGYFVEALPGRTISNARRPEIPVIETVLLKLSATRVLKGDYRDFYFVEYIGHSSIVGELNAKLYSREILFLLRPAHTIYDSRDAEISASSRAANELGDNQPLYNFTLRSTAFTLSETGGLVSPIDISREFNELYSDVRSLDELALRITTIEDQN